MYLLGETSSQIGHELDDRARAELVEEYFSRYLTYTRHIEIIQDI